MPSCSSTTWSRLNETNHECDSTIRGTTDLLHTRRKRSRRKKRQNGWKMKWFDLCYNSKEDSNLYFLGKNRLMATSRFAVRHITGLEIEMEILPYHHFTCATLAMTTVMITRLLKCFGEFTGRRSLKTTFGCMYPWFCQNEYAIRAQMPCCSQPFVSWKYFFIHLNFILRNAARYTLRVWIISVTIAAKQ